jgi:hypothetical protein
VTRAELITCVRAALNDKQPFEEETISGLDGLPSKPVKAYIDEAIDRSMEEMLLTAPVKLLKTNLISLNSANVETKYLDFIKHSSVYKERSSVYACIALPEDYLRFVSLWLPPWNHYLNALTDDKWRKRQFFEYTMADEEAPCAFETIEGTKRVIYAFPYYAVLVTFAGKLSYVPEYDCNFGKTVVDVEHDTAMYIKNALLNALIYSVAMKVLVYFGRDASGMAALYKAAMLSAEKS